MTRPLPPRMFPPNNAPPARSAGASGRDGGRRATFSWLVRSASRQQKERTISPMRHLALILAPLASLALAVPPALACTPAPGYRVPTNLELAADANAIILGEVVGGLPGSDDDALSAGIAVRPLVAVKGLLPSGDIRISGMMLAQEDVAGPSDPNEFSEAHPDAYRGACIRRVFPRGAQVLFFLSRADAEWVPAGGPFSRWAEDVPGADAPWVALAGLYAHAALLQPEERTAMLEDQHEALLARADDPVAQSMAEDIARQLAGPNPPPPGNEPPPPQPIFLPEDDPAGSDAPAMAEETPAPAGDIGEVEAAIDAMGAARE